VVGRGMDDQIIYGKEGSEFIDDALRARLAAGTLVTVWTPSKRGCP